jgi:hypothetical protein
MTKYSSPWHTYDKRTHSWDAPSATPNPAGPTGSTASCPPDCDSGTRPPDSEPGHTIELIGTPEEIARLRAILDELRKTPSGRKLLTDIDNAYAKNGHRVEMKLGGTGTNSSGTDTQLNDNDNAINGTGCNPAVVTIDRDLEDKNSYVYDKDGKKIDATRASTAAHELTHALNGINGTQPKDAKNADPDNKESEAQAIRGENDYRRECVPKLPERDPGNHRGGYKDEVTKDHDTPKERNDRE